MRRAKLGAALCALTVVCGSGLSALAQSAPAPQPAASTLPIIGGTHSRGLCTTVRDSVAPMVLGLMKSDELVGAGHRALLKTADDQRSGSRAAMDIDQVYLRHAVDAMVHNLGVIDKLLADEKRFPKKAPATDDERIAQQLKAQIQAVEERQRAALNTIANALDAEDLGRMQNDFPSGISAINTDARRPKGLVNPERGPDSEGSFIGVAGLIMPQMSSPPMGTAPPAARTHSSTLGHTVWDRLAAGLEMHQTAIAGAEQRLTPTIVAISVACRAELSPSPSPTP